MNEKLIEYIKKIIEKYCYCDWKENSYGGCFHYQIYADYRDEGFDNKTLIELCEMENPVEAFNERLIVAYEQHCFDIEDEIIRNVRTHWASEEFSWSEHEDEISTMEEASAVLEDDEYDEEKLIVYSHSKPRGFYVKQRKLELDEVRLLAECIYTSRFVTQSEAKRLISVVDDLTTAENAKKIKPDALVTDRVRTTNKSVLNNLSVIHTAMSSKIDGKPHTPEKITFQLQYHTLESKDKPVPKKTKYVVSPYKLLVNDGNYYLSAFEDKSQQMKNYRVDRMKKMPRGACRGASFMHFSYMSAVSPSAPPRKLGHIICICVHVAKKGQSF